MDVVVEAEDIFLEQEIGDDVGATTDRTFRAFDSRSGKELWSVELPNNSIATPMTYRGKNGKQYVATEFSAGLNIFNHPKPAGPGTNQIVVFGLP